MTFVLADEDLEPDVLLRSIVGSAEAPVFTTAIDLEGSVLAHMIAAASLPIRIVTLDTGLFFPATYDTWKHLEARLGIRIEPIRPTLDLPAQAREHGDELWTQQPDRCCGIRKVEPLRRVLDDADVWITGIRREQTPERATAPQVETDARFGVRKVNPLAGWSLERVQDYLRQHRVPYNPMFDDGYPSIGCAPCTRRVTAGESARAGRWSGFDKRECGLHFETSADGTVQLGRGPRA